MPFYVYILYSTKLNRFYTGTTNDANHRLQEHNSGVYDDSYTIKGIPWKLYLLIECESSEQAYKLERFIKQMKSSAFIKRLKENNQIVLDLLKRFA